MPSMGNDWKNSGRIYKKRAIPLIVSGIARVVLFQQLNLYHSPIVTSKRFFPDRLVTSFKNLKIETIIEGIKKQGNKFLFS